MISFLKKIFGMTTKEIKKEVVYNPPKYIESPVKPVMAIKKTKPEIKRQTQSNNSRMPPKNLKHKNFNSLHYDQPMDMTDPLNPFNPLGLVNPISPFSPLHGILDNNREDVAISHNHTSPCHDSSFESSHHDSGYSSHDSSSSDSCCSGGSSYDSGGSCDSSSCGCD